MGEFGVGCGMGSSEYCVQECNRLACKSCEKDRVTFKWILLEQCGYFGLDSDDSGQSSDALSTQQRKLFDDTQCRHYRLQDATESV